MFKPYVVTRMKLEPFPWLPEYYVDLHDNYVDLTLEKIKNEIYGQFGNKLKNYQKLFSCNVRAKILIKADPGMGKTTLGKKMACDWAKGAFKHFSMVFFMFLKFVRPGELIEDVIFQQNSELEGLNVSKAKLRDFLQHFGNKCLIILDGLDEHGLGKNEDVLKIIRNQKLIDCGIIVTSHPHGIRDIEQYFLQIVRVDGFTQNEPKKFVSKFFPGWREKQKILQILKFRPSDS